jgi:catechol 2,3-dioxygenase-like lactoylglutathione lyase family enzyme
LTQRAVLDKSNALWEDAWFDAIGTLGMAVWRGVESQHDISTLRLVDSREEHDALEALLEQSKPPKPEGSQGLHYLLFAPLRYTSSEPSRFRRAGDGGVWYGGDSVETACAEVAYWRYRFIIQSAGLAKDDSELVTRHTFFRAQADGSAIDLTGEPWSARGETWAHPTDYAGLQALAAEARSRGIEWIRYSSIGNPGAHCAAVLSVSALAKSPPQDLDEWHCRATRHRVLFFSRAGGVTYSWDF